MPERMLIMKPKCRMIIPVQLKTIQSEWWKNLSVTSISTKSSLETLSRLNYQSARQMRTAHRNPHRRHSHLFSLGQRQQLPIKKWHLLWLPKLRLTCLTSLTSRVRHLLSPCNSSSNSSSSNNKPLQIPFPPAALLKSLSLSPSRHSPLPTTLPIPSSGPRPLSLLPPLPPTNQWPPTMPSCRCSTVVAIAMAVYLSRGMLCRVGCLQPSASAPCPPPRPMDTA